MIAPDLTLDASPGRPRTRADCLPGGCNAARPCPFVRCKHHLYLDVNVHGGLTLNFPGLEPWQLAETCALDVADRGPQALDTVATMLNVTREGARRSLLGTLARMRGLRDLARLYSELGDEPARDGAVSHGGAEGPRPGAVGDLAVVKRAVELMHREIVARILFRGWTRVGGDMFRSQDGRTVGINEAARTVRRGA